MAMRTKVLRVVSQTEAVEIPSKKEGKQPKCMIRLREPGGDFEDEYLCAMFGNLALLKYEPDDVVVATLQFRTHEANGNLYQDITVKEMMKLSVKL